MPKPLAPSTVAALISSPRKGPRAVDMSTPFDDPVPFQPKGPHRSSVTPGPLASDRPVSPRQTVTIPTKQPSTETIGRLAFGKSLWKGPVVDGITYSMLCKFLQCPERFRLKVVEGLSEPDVWNHHMQYGSIFHEAMEAASGGKPWQPAIINYGAKLLEKYPADQADISKWISLAQMQFPIYERHWRKHETEVGRKPIFEEKPFRISYTVPALGNLPAFTLTLRGKIDAAYERKGFVYLQENKTKGEIDADGISLTIDQNLQTCIYHLALRSLLPEKKGKIAGTMYNVIRRPLSDWHGPRKGKKETMATFIKRVGKWTEQNASKQFYRWIVPVADRHLERFRRESLDPILRFLCVWWYSIEADPFHPEKSPWHFRFPFGVYHSMERGYRGDYFNLLTTGSKAGLDRIDNLFPEVH